MKRIKKILVVTLALAFSIAAFTSCSLLDKSSQDQARSFKHKDPLPKKFIINQKSSKIIK
jgi:hypothetical protein